MKTDNKENLRKLGPEAFDVTQEKGTEAPFSGKYWNHKETGIYHCLVCGKPLFSSDTKFDSGTGWPSFTKPANLENIDLAEDLSLGIKRIEVKCKNCGAHLGHLFPDGPEPEGKRYCINSCSLNFQPEHKTINNN